ncbi:MAG: hypothetical protein PGN13_00720 [Patulibacter minatonensis]
MTELPISMLAKVVEQLPVPVVLTTATGSVVAASHASHPFIGNPRDGATLDGLLEHLTPVPTTTHHPLTADGEPHLLVAIDGHEPPPADVAALARATAHDFNNLLGVIINFASLAASEVPAGSSAAQDLQEVLVASRRAATLTQRLLQIAASAPDERG